MPAYDGLIFDLDGTLWNTLAPVTTAWNEFARTKQGIPEVSESQIRGIMGLSHEEAFAKLLPSVEPELRARTAREFHGHEVNRLDASLLYKGVEQGIAKLSQAYPLFLVSNCETVYLERFLRHSGLGGFFKDSECYGGTKRPKGENIALVMRRNELERAAYVGDTAGDQAAARHAGADYYHVKYGFGSPAQECFEFDSFEQVCQFFLETLSPFVDLGT